VIWVPPLEAGAVQETSDCELALEVAVVLVGALGSVAAIVGVVGADEGLVPTALVATTVKV
jgi:hypothetical protein